MLAQHRSRLDVEIVERDDPIDVLGLGQVSRALADIRLGHVPADIEERVDGLPRPVAVAELLLGQEQDPAPEPVALAQEVVSLPVGGDTEEC